jgi:O-succinylbenzoic acid--CoA ligase
MRDWLSIRRAASPETTALVDVETDQLWTYRDLDESVDVIAGRFASLGVSSGDRVGVIMETRPTFVELIWATQRLGATLVPFNARLTPDEIADQWGIIDPTLLVTESAHESMAKTVTETAPILSVDEPESDGVEWIDTVEPSVVDPVETPLSATLVIMFTSGTTGDPKPVRVTARNVLANAVASAFRLGVVPQDEWLLNLPMYHMGGLSIPIRTTIYGTRTVMRRGFAPEAVLKTLRDRSITGISLVPTMLKRLLDAGMTAESLRFVLVGGGPTSVDLAKRALDAGIPIHPTYGMTETASQITTATPDDVRQAPGTVGRPLAGTDIVIVDAAGDPVERGKRGEIVVSGWTVSPGYYGTAEREEVNRKKSAAGESAWFNTGDIGYRDESGRLFVTGRANEQIVTGGENVAPAEVRQAILAHPAIEDAVVLGLPDDEWGERVGALVVAENPIDQSGLRSFLEDRLAGFKLPRTVAQVESLPRTPSGTIDREAARSLFSDADA